MADAARAAAIVGRVPSPAQRSVSAGPSLCFVTGQGRAVLMHDVALLDPQASDAELAAQLVHVAVHHADRLADGCARGLAVALDSEQRAFTAESQARRDLGLPPPPAPAAAVADYRSRCRPAEASLEAPPPERSLPEAQRTAAPTHPPAL